MIDNSSLLKQQVSNITAPTIPSRRNAKLGIDRQAVLGTFKRNDVGVVFHHVPINSSPAGKRYGWAHGDLAFTNSVSERLIRLPLWVGLSETQQESVVETLARALRTNK